MSKDQPTISLGESNPQPPTPRQTPTSAVFPSPIFQTPNRNPFCNDSSGRTPRFAEDYSVFNSIPGDLRGTQRPFGDLDQDGIKYTHRRVLSAEGLAIEIATHANHFSPNPDLPLPPVDPARRLASSPNSVNIPKEYSADTENLLSPNSSKYQQSTKKARRGTATESEPTQTATPPPTDRRGKRKLAPNLTMQNDQSFAQPDFTGASQQHELAALMAASGDMFGYPMSAPAAAPANFWDPSMGMDLDFGAPQTHIFQSTPVSSHRHTGSFDWNSEIPLFQEPSAPHHSNQEGMMHTRRERALAPKPSVSGPLTTATNIAMATAFAPQMDDPFNMMNPGDAVDPGLLFGRSQSLMDISFNSMAPSGSAEAAIAESGSRSSMGGDLRRSASFQDVRNTNVPDRTFASSPVKSSSRAGLNRSMSENRGKRAQPRPSLPKLAPAPRPVSQASNGSNVEPGRPMARPSGRSSPLKHQHRLSSLASIPEASPQPPTWRSVRFTIDSRGRARAEATVVVGSSSSNGNISPRRTSRDSSRKEEWEASDDESSTDDEPIIIPSRNNSFNASFALPDPRKPVGSIFHSSKRSSSERSLGSFSNDGPSPQHEGDSEAETVMNDAKDKVGDAASELRKLVEDRQKRSTQMGSARGQRFLQTNNLGSFRGDTISPSTLTESSHSTDRHEVRCVCHRNRVDEGDGFMVQWFVTSCVFE
ncbi:Fc.00g109140.m01.CDS01 [Cosmosporella sp. VM-42]